MIFFWIFVIVIILIFSLDQLIERMVRCDVKTLRITPEKHQITFDEVLVPGVKQAQLYGCWIPFSPDAPTLILVHGWGRNLARMMPRLHTHVPGV